MSISIYAGNLQRTGEYPTKGIRDFHGIYWTFPTQKYIHFPPLVAHGKVYVGCNDGYLYAIDQETGGLRWGFKTESADSITDDPLASVDSESTGVICVCLTETAAFLGDITGMLYEVDLQTGHLLWKRALAEISQDESGPIPPIRLVATKELLFVWGLHGFCGLDLVTRAPLWWGGSSGGFLGDRIFCPTLDEHRLVFATTVWHSGDQILEAYDLSTQQGMWRQGDEAYLSGFQDGARQSSDFTNETFGAVPVMDGLAYLAGAIFIDDEERDDDEVGGLMVIDASTGELQWFYETGDGFGYTAVANGLAYLVGEDVYALDIATHQLRWRCQEVSGIPSLADGTLYLANGNGLITALDALSGQMQWTFQIDGKITTPCTLADGMIFVAAGGTVYALH